MAKLRGRELRTVWLEGRRGVQRETAAVPNGRPVAACCCASGCTTEISSYRCDGTDGEDEHECVAWHPDGGVAGDDADFPYLRAYW